MEADSEMEYSYVNFSNFNRFHPDRSYRHTRPNGKREQKYRSKNQIDVSQLRIKLLCDAASVYGVIVSILFSQCDSLWDAIIFEWKSMFDKPASNDDLSHHERLSK